MNTIKIVQTSLNTNLTIEGILLTMYDTRLRLSNQVVDEVRSHFKEMVLNDYTTKYKVGRGPSFGESIITFDVESKGSISYLNLAREIIQRNEK